MAVGLFATTAVGQVTPPVLVRPATGPVADETPAPGTPDSAPEEAAARQFAGGAPLRTDPELESMLRQAEKFVDAGRVDLACLRWQQILEQARDVVASRDGRVYEPLSRGIERRIAGLPPEGRRSYRLQVDGRAAAILAGGGGRERADAEGDLAPDTPEGVDGPLGAVARREGQLADVIRLYFLSSYGDDAAFELACRMLDRGDLASASRLFERLITDYPDGDVPRAEVQLRLAVARQLRGDAVGAAEAVAAIDPAGLDGGPDRLATVRSMVTAEPGPGADRPTVRLAGIGTTGTPEKLPRLAPGFLEKSLTVAAEFDLGLATAVSGAYRPETSGAAISGTSASTNPDGRRRRGRADDTGGLASTWSEGRRPAAEIAFAGGEPIVRTWIDVARLRPERKTVTRWRSAWWNGYAGDAALRQLLLSGNTVGGMATSLGEAQMFVDTVHSDLTVADGAVYVLEGPPRVRLAGDPAQTQSESFQWGQVLRRKRTNRLSAFDAATGKTLWSHEVRLGQGGEPVGLLAAPTARRGTLLVPASDGSSLYLVALSGKTGERLWSTYLCDEPPSGSSPTSRPAVLVSGREVYVLPGTGVLFGLDAEYGDVRFAVRYERDVEDDAGLVNNGVSGLGRIKGWARDELFLLGGTIVLCPSDHDGLIALDLADLAIHWKSPRTPLNHAADRALGVTGDALVVAGPQCVRRYEVSTGRLLWEATTDRQTGLPLLTEEGVLVPAGRDVVRVDLQTGRIAHTTPVQLAGGDLVGNLAGDGASLWSVGLTHVLRLVPTDAAEPPGDDEPASGRPSSTERTRVTSPRRPDADPTSPREADEEIRPAAPAPGRASRPDLPTFPMPSRGADSAEELRGRATPPPRASLPRRVPPPRAVPDPPPAP